jgi:hypothetical protein
VFSWHRTALLNVHDSLSQESQDKGVTAMKEGKLWWLLLLVAFLGGVGLAFGG